MSNFNQVIVMGRATKDCEMRYLSSGTAVAQISLAINRKYKHNNETKEETAFVDCEAFGKQAEVLAEYIKKGSAVHIVGRLKTDTWDDKASGQKRSKLKVVVESFQFVGGREECDSTPATRPASAPTKPATALQDAPETDDVPF